MVGSACIKIWVKRLTSSFHSLNDVVRKSFDKRNRNFERDIKGITSIIIYF